MRICSTCGERNEDWMDICQRCGSSIANANVDNSYDTSNYNNYNNYDNNYDDYNNGYNGYDNNYYQDPARASNSLPKAKRPIANLDLKIILVISVIILVFLIIYTFFM